MRLLMTRASSDAPLLPRLLLLPLLLFTLTGAQKCEPWCTDSCFALNGNIQIECGGCPEEGHRCFPGADGWEGWQERRAAVVNADGTVQQQPRLEDGVVERTAKSLVYETAFYDQANRKRNADAVAATLGAHWDWEPLPVPQETPRHCEVHSCVLIDGDDACANGRSDDCKAPRGHLRPIGEQWGELDEPREHDVRETPLDAKGFWLGAMAASRPLVLRGGASAITNSSEWSDEALLEDCTLGDKNDSWHVLVEKQNRITQNDRHPLMEGWTFCQFLESFDKPEYKNMLYLVNSIAVPGGKLRKRLQLPGSLACPELYESMHDARLWMSRGNTTSSLHFDTHENMLMQIDGTKEVLLWHPNATQHFYMDHHTKYGLSPINVDRVDMERFPSIVNAPPLVARLNAGDAVYIPDSWWHVIRSHGSTIGENGRNIAVALEMMPYSGEMGVWPREMIQMRETPGLYWAESVRINAAMRERYSIEIPSHVTHKPIVCEPYKEEAMPTSLEACDWLGKDDH